MKFAMSARGLGFSIVSKKFLYICNVDDDMEIPI
jgi:hypothetical protein